MKRALSVVLSVLMVFSCFATLLSTVVYAEEPISGVYPILSALGHADGDITILAGKVGTEDTTTVMDRSSFTHESDFLPGDVDGNGEIDVVDYLLAKKHQLGSYTLTAEEFERADINQDGEVNALDYLAVKKHTLGSFTLPQSFTITEPGQSYDNFALIVVGADNKIISVNMEEGDKRDTAIPEGGYVIAFDLALLTGDAPQYDISALAAGVELVLSGITVEEVAALTAPKELEGASFAIAEEPIVEPVGAYVIKTFAGYASGDVALFLRQGDKKALQDFTGKDYNAYALIIVGADGIVADLDLRGPGRPAGVKGDVEVPEGGFIIAINRDVAGYPIENISEAFTATGVKVGDAIVLYGIDLDATAASANAGDDLANVTFDVIPLDPVPEEAVMIDYAQGWKADICAIYTRLATGEKTFGEVTGVTTGKVQDSTWWNAILVDANGKVIERIGMVSKTDVEIPEGGYMLAAHGSSPALNLFASIELGSTITLYNCDLEGFANLTEGEALVKSAFTVTEPEVERPLSYQKSYSLSGPDGWNYWSNGKLEDDGVLLTNGKKGSTAGDTVGNYVAVSGLGGKSLVVTVDLGDEYWVDRFLTSTAKNSGWGIPQAKYVAVSYSLDGENFKFAAALENDEGTISAGTGEGWTAYEHEITLDTAVKARFVKFEVSTFAAFCWIDEVEVWESDTIPEEYVVIDGVLDDDVWKEAEFKKIDGQNAGTWQNKPSDYTFEYAIAEKDGYAYFAVRSDKADMTQLRVWFHTNPEAKLYTHFFDVYTNGSAGGLKTNQSLTINSGSPYDATKLDAAFDADKKVFEAKVKLEDVGAETLGADDVNVQLSDGNALHSRDFLNGNFTIDDKMVTSAYMPWVGWFDGEIPTYAGLIPKTNHWTLTPVNGEYVKYYYVDDALYVVDEAQWPYMTNLYPESDLQAYDIEGNNLRYDFSITNGTASIRLIFKTDDGTVQYMMSNTALNLGADQYYASNGDFKATSCSGVISLKELVESKQLYQNSDFPAAAIKDGKITFAGLEIFAIGGATVVIDELAVEPAPVFDEGTWKWAEDFSSAKLTFYAENVDQTLELDATVSSETVDPTCEQEGKIIYTAKVTFEDKEYTDVQEKAIEALGHTWSVSRWIWAGDYSMAIAKIVCSKDASHTKLLEAEVTSETTDPTCEEAGQIAYTAVAKLGEEEFTDTATVVLDALGHDYDVENIVWTWNDDNTAATATFTCKRDKEHTLTLDAVITIATTTAPTYTEDGEETITATVTLDGKDYTDEKKNLIPALGYTYSTDPTWTWTGFESAVATFTADEDDTVKKDVNATITSAVTLDPTCEGTGTKTYTATVSFNGKNYSDTKDETLEALGHDWDTANGVWTWADDFSSAKFSFACKRDGTHTQELDATVTSEVTTDPTCEADGVRTYTAKVTFEEVEYSDTKDDAEPATGHDWDTANGVWTWADDFSTAKITFTCENDDTHIYEVEATITSEVTTDPTIYQEGVRTYTAKATFEETEYSDTTTGPEPMVAFTPEEVPATAKAIKSFAAYANGDVSILVRLAGGQKTIAEITGVTVGSEKDYNSYYLILVDKDGNVCGIDQRGPGRPDGVKGDVEVPEGGYILAINCYNVDYLSDLFAAVAEGDKVKLYNVDLAALALLEETISLESYNAAFEVKNTIDANFTDDDVWKDAEWITIDGAKNGTWQNGNQLKTSDYTFDYAVAADSTYLYIGAKGSKEAMTQLRVWFRTNDEATLYTHFFDVWSDSTKDYGLKKNNSLTTNSGSAYDASKVKYAFDKGAFEVRLKLADIDASGLEGLEYIVQMGDGVVNLLAGEMLYGWSNAFINMPWNNWVQEEYPQYAGIVPKTNRWTVTPGGDGTIAKFGYEGDTLILQATQGWPCMQYVYPLGDEQTYAIEGNALYYNFDSTVQANITMVFADSKGNTYTFPLSNSALFLQGGTQYDTGSGDFLPGHYEGSVPLEDLVKAYSNYGKNLFPQNAIEDGNISFAGLAIWASGTNSTVTITELAVEPYTPTEGLAFDWVDEWNTANGVSGGAWQETDVPSVPHSFDYAAEYDEANDAIRLGVKFHGVLTGTEASYGNGNGTNIRLWIRDPGTGYVAFSHFIDISYNGSVWLTRINENHPTDTKPNNSSALYAYGADSYPYTVTAKNTDRGADIEVLIPMNFVSSSGVAQVIFAVSNKNGTNYCLYHGPRGGSAAWNPWDGANSINLSGAALPEEYAKSDNLALHKSVAFAGAITESGTYMGDLTDGVGPTAGSYTGVWYAFRKGTATATIDLGEVYDNVSFVRANIWPANKSGIVPPKSVKFLVSEDGSTFVEAGALDMTDSRFTSNTDTAYWFEANLYGLYKARYFRVEVVTDGTFSFFSEVEVYATKPAEFIQPTHGYTYTTDSVNVIGYKLGKTLGEVKDKTHAWWNLAVVEWDVDENAYVVKEVLLGDGNTSDFHNVEIPLYGFVLGTHGAEMPDAAAFIASLSAGDKLYLYNIDIDAITEVDVALDPEAMVSKDEITGRTAYDPGIVVTDYRILNFAAYAAGDVSIVVRQGEKITISDVTGGKDYNYYRIIVVDQNGTVIDINEKLGRAEEVHSPADGRKDLVEVPEGGYIIAIHDNAIVAAGSAYADLFGEDGVKLGDAVDLYNIDLEELASLAAGTALNKYACFGVSRAPYTSVTASNGRWQSAKENAPITYKIALNDDGEWLYVNVLADGKFAEVVDTFRFWIRSSDDATVYTHFYDVDIAEDGTVTNKAKYNKSLTANSGDNITDSSMTFAASAVGEKTKINFKVKLSEFGGEDGFAYYAALHEKGVDYFYYPAPTGTGTADVMPYNVWDVTKEGLYNKDRLDQVGDYKFRSFAGYANADVNLFVRLATGEKTLNEIGNLVNGRTTTDYNAYKVFTVDADGFVTGIYTLIGRPDGVKSDVEVPEGGFAIGVSVYDNSGTGALKDDAALAIFDTLKVGDYVELSNVDLDEVAESHHINAYASFNVQFIEEVPAGAYSITHFGLYRADICSILVPLATGENKVGTITKVTMGSAQNFTWWNAIIVGADGKVTKVIGMTDKTNEVIPDGGFMLLAHGSHPALNVFSTAAVGEIVTLYNVDRAKLATTTHWKELIQAAFTIKADDTIVRPVSYQKSYTVTGNTRTDSYKDDGVKLTDGKTSDNGGTAASSGLPTADGPSVTVDLGEAMSVDLFKVHSFGGSWGINNITGFTVEISTDGSTFTAVNAASVAGSPADSTWQATWFTIDLGEAVSARYVKFVPVGGNYLWTDEVEVWAAD